MASRAPSGPFIAVSVLAVSAFLLALATPSLALPVGTATTNGTSMGHSEMHVLVYADAPPASVDVGDAVIYRADDRYIHHRVVAETDAGYVTKGDAVGVTDQSVGYPYVTRENLVGVVVLSVPISWVWGLAGVLTAVLALLRALDRRAAPPRTS